MSNTFGTNFRVTSFGESHGEVVGAVVDGCPAGLEISVEDIQRELDRRRPGQSDIVTPRDEKDGVEILSGVFEGVTTGAPILLLARNAAARSQDYDHLKDVMRPSHADYTYQQKFGLRDYRGGGRSSARVTLGWVAAGAIAKKFLAEKGVEILSYVEQVGDVRAEVDPAKVKMKEIEGNVVRCPDVEVAEQMIELIKEVRGNGDTVGGMVRGIVRGVPVGIGEPVFDKLHANLGKAMLSINAVKGFEIGSGFAGAQMRGSEHNDEFYSEAGKVRTRTNYSGGVQGGISNGEDILFRVAFKPVATLMQEQKTVDSEGEEIEMRAFGRHDACVLPRAVPIVDAMTAIVLMDLWVIS